MGARATALLPLALAVAALAPASPAAAATRTVDVTAAPYNAAGDGTTNDRAAIQAAIDDVSDSGGGTVVLPAGRTFLSGNLSLRNKVTLEIDGTLKQSQDPGDYTYDPILGHTAPGKSYGAFFINYPFIYAGHRKDVGVTGDGTILMTRAAGDTEQEVESNTIHVIPIGFYAVDVFTISGVDIEMANNYNVALWSSEHGVVSGITIYATHRNTDGINAKNSHHIRITGSTITNKDDAIIVGSGYDDPRDGTWWQSNPHDGGSSDVEIDHNTIRVIPLDPSHLRGQGAKAIAFIPWGTNAPDPRWTELSDISIHDNRLYARQSIGCWCDNPYRGSGQDMWDHSPIKRVHIYDNDYRWFDGSANTQMSTIHWARITDLRDDFGKLGEPDFLNGDFEHTGTAYWSTRGDAGATSTDVSPLRSDEARRAAAEQTGAWGWYGYVQDAGAALYEGLGLNAGIPYSFRVDVRTGTLPARVFAENTCTGEVVAGAPVTATSARTVELRFRATSTCSDYHVGVETTADGGWALLDRASLTPAVETINNEDEHVAYAGSWILLGDGSFWDPYWGPIGGDWRWGVSTGASVTTTFTGRRAWLFVFKRTDAGIADIYVDGEYRETVDLYHYAWVHHQVAYDTGDLAPGSHTLSLVTTGVKDPASTDDRTTFDAVLVEP